MVRDPIGQSNAEEYRDDETRHKSVPKTAREAKFSD